MKKLKLALILLVCILFCALPRARASERRLTLMIYMCGSNLESAYGSATADIQEILASGFDAKQVSVLIMTGGSDYWNMGFDPTQINISEVGKRGMRVVWNSGAMSMGEPETLTQLLEFGVENYPAEEYALILWDHGGGPLEGVCWDELFSMDNLKLSELTGALEAARLPQALSWVGFDACLMGSAEVASALAPYASYMIASQETEPAKGWNYAFLRGIEADADGSETGRRIVDAYFEALTDCADVLTLACVDLSGMERLTGAMDAFFTPMGEAMDSEAFIRLSGLRMASTGFGKAVRGMGEDGYDLVDLRDLTEKYGGAGSELEAALDEAVVYCRSSRAEAGGLSVYHPYANKQRYEESWRADYAALSFCAGYSHYMEAFGTLLTGEEMADWHGLATSDDGFDERNDNLFSLQLTPEQQAGFASAQLMVLANPFSDTNDRVFAPVSVANVRPDENGLLSAVYTGKTLYMTDEQGSVLCGPVSFRLAEDGSVVILAYYWEQGRFFDAVLDRSKLASVLLSCVPSAENPDELEVASVRVWDDATKTFTNRIAFSEDRFSHMGISYLLRKMPEAEDVLPAFDDWENSGGENLAMSTIDLPVKWRLRYFDAQQSGMQLSAMFQVTDVQQNSYCSRPVPVRNRNVRPFAVEPAVFSGEDYDVSLTVSMDVSALSPGLRMQLDVTNRSGGAVGFSFSDIVLNGSRTVNDSWRVAGLEAGASAQDVVYIEPLHLSGLSEITEISCVATIARDNDGRTEVPLRFTVSGGDVTAIAPALNEAMAEAESDAALWQLLSLSQAADGTLNGCLRVENRSDGALDVSETQMLMLADGLSTLTTWEMPSLAPTVAGRTDALLPFHIANRMWLTGLNILPADAQDAFRTVLEEDHALEHAGHDAVHSIELAMSYDYGAGRFRKMICLALDEPLPLAAEPAEWLPLAEGGVRVRAVGAVVGEMGVGLILEARNDTEEDVELELAGAGVNGLDEAVSAWWSCLLPAESAALSTVSLTYTGAAPGQGVSDIALSFRYGDMLTEEAHIRLPEPAAPEKGTALRLYAARSDFETEPAAFASLSQAITLDGAAVTREEFSANLAMDYVDGAAGRQLRLTMDFANLTGGDSEAAPKALSVSTTHVVLNDARTTGAYLWSFAVSADSQEQLKAFFDPIDLRGLSRIDSISFVLTVASDGEMIAEVPLRFAVSGCDVSPESLPEPLAQAEQDGVLWQLLSLSQEEDGEITGLLRAVNGSGEPQDWSDSSLLANGVRTDDALSLDVAAGTDRIASFTFGNRAAMSSYLLPAGGCEGADSMRTERILEHRGEEALTDLRLLLGFSTDTLTFERTLDLRLEEPFPLRDAASCGRWEPAVPLLEGVPEVRVRSVMLGDSRIGLHLELRNDTDRDNLLALWEGAVDGQSIPPYGTWHTYNILPAHSVTEKCVVLKGDGVLEPGDEIHEIVFSLQAIGVPKTTAVLRLPEGSAMGRDGGLLIGTDALESEPAATE